MDKTRTWAAAQRQHLWPSGAPERSTRHDEGGTTSSWSEIETLLFAGDPIERALAAHSLGRATVRSARARHAAMLVDVMGRDPYPAVRHLAWRALRALTGEPTLLPEFVPERGPAERARSLLTISERFALTPADAARVPALRAQAEAQAIDIGE